EPQRLKMPAPYPPAEFPETVDRVMETAPLLSLVMPPPFALAELPEMVLSMSERTPTPLEKGPAWAMPPLLPSVELAVSVLRLRVSVPTLTIPPAHPPPVAPDSAEFWDTVVLLRVSVPVASWKMPPPTPLKWPLTTRLFDTVLSDRVSVP